jgi:hypothetical protein
MRANAAHAMAKRTTQKKNVTGRQQIVIFTRFIPDSPFPIQISRFSPSPLLPFAAT